MSKEYKILLSIGLGAVALAIILFKFAGEPAQKMPLVERTGTYMKGSATAKVTVTEFADFQCPACKTANDISNQLLLAYPNDVKFVFRHFPLSGHPLSMIAAQAVEAAGTQGKFWEMSDLLFEKQSEWGSTSDNKSREEALALFIGYAGQLGLDQAAFKQAVESNTFTDVINQDLAAGSAAGVNGTPSFYVNNVLVSQPSFEAIKQEIDKALAQ